METRNLSAQELVNRLAALLATERQTTLEILLHLQQVQLRKVDVDLGYDSLAAFCHQRLKMSRSTAWRRSLTVDLITRLPRVVDYLRDGRITMSALYKLEAYLEPASYVAVLDAAAGKEEDGIALLVESLKPRSAQMDLLGSTPANGAGTTEAAPARPAMVASATSPSPSRAPSDLPWRTYFTMDRAFAAQIEEAKELLSNKLPGAGLDEILRESVVRLVRDLRRRRQGCDDPRPGRVPPPAKGRRIPAHMRREVFRRDGAGGCCFVGSDGKRCGSRHQLVIDHIVPVGKGGVTEVANLRVLCSVHNQHEADRIFGRDFMERKRGRKPAGENAAQGDPVVSAETSSGQEGDRGRLDC
jgi:5-methylcytosine-specific restriction endonuclease McrA